MRRPDIALTAAGAAGGLFGALFAHLAVVGAHRIDPLASLYFKGPHGAPFFSLFFNAGVYYAVLGAALFRGARRKLGAGLGFAAAFVPGVLVMSAATRAFNWGENPGDGETLAWFYLVLGLYTLSCASAVGLLGWRAEAGTSGDKDWRTARGALIGCVAGYAVGWSLNWLVPSLHPPYPPGVLPQLGDLTDGGISGAAIAAGISIFAKHDQTRAPKAPSAARAAA